MSVTGLKCGACGETLQHSEVKDANGNTVQVSKCPKNCGKIKSPVCCGHDMEAINQ